MEHAAVAEAQPLESNSRVLAGRVAIVTGATSGIGAEIARRLGGAGAQVVVAGRDARRGNDVAAAIAADSGEALFAPHETTSETSAQGVVDRAVGAFGRLDVIVNNAGTYMRGASTDVDVEQFDQAFARNVRGAVLLTAAGLPHMVTQRWGRVLVTSSVSALASSGNDALYAATKAALNAFVRSWAAEFAPYGVTSNALAPGAVRTPLTAALLDDERTRGPLVANIPDGRVAEPADVAAAALFLASPAAGHINGQTLGIDGGLSVTR